MKTLRLGEFWVEREGSIDPSKHKEETFDLYSIPAYDAGRPDVVEGNEIGSSKKMVRPGDVLLSRIVPHIRRVWIVGDNDGRRQIASGEWIIYRAASVHPRYLRWWLATDRFHVQFMRTVAGVGGSLLRARPSEVARIEVPLPPLEEQRRIAAILDKADAIRRKRQQAIELTETFLRSVFLEMFGDPVTNPKGWQMRQGADIFESLTYGTSKKCDATPVTGIPVLRIPNIVAGEISFADLKYARLTESEIDSTRLMQGDLLFVRSNGNPDYIGRCAVAEGQLDVSFASYLIRGRVRETSGMLPGFLKAELSFPSYRSKIAKEARTTAGNYNISTVGLRNLLLIVPPVDLQKEFLRVAQLMTLRLAQCEQFAHKSLALQASIAQELFSGSVLPKSVKNG